MRYFLVFAITLSLVGTGCSFLRAEVQLPTLAQKDPFEQIIVGGALSLDIPPHCEVEGAAGSTYISCAPEGTEQSQVDMIISTDGTVFHVRRGEGYLSPYWDDMVASIRVLTPQSREIQLTIES